MAKRRVNNSKTFQVFTHLPSNMGRRAEEIRAVGAYVEPACTRHSEVYSAVSSAAEEEYRLQQIHELKQQRLKQFQDDVKLRVQRLEKQKREEQLRKSYQAVEEERNIVRQTAFAAEPHISRRDNLSTRTHPHNHSIVLSSSQASSNEDTEESSQSLAEQTKQIKEFSQQARKKLHQRKVGYELGEEFPTTVWKKRDNQSAPHPFHKNDDDFNSEDEASGVEIYIHEKGSDDEGYCKENNVPDIEITDVKSVHFEDEREKEEEFIKHKPEGKKKSKKQSSVCSSSTGSGSSLAKVVPVRPGVTSEEEKLRRQRQRAMYRRLFMDIERETVREQQKRLQHRKNINRLKREKEEERKRVETECERLVAPVDPLTGETAEETAQRQRLEAELLRISIEEQKQKAIKAREADRFVDALKAGLRERVSSLNLDLPPLCCCGNTLWDTNPDTCANNCVFYRNPKAYAKALQSLLASCDVV